MQENWPSEARALGEADENGEHPNMFRTHALTIAISVLLAFAAQAQPVTLDVLDEYAHHPGTERLNTPADEIEWLREHKLIHGELDDFPEAAIILHRVDVARYLRELGFEGYTKSFSYGFTDPVLVFVVRRPGMRPFAVVRGLPGAGGVTTEAAELRAMGTNSFVHVGTAGLLSPDIPYGQLIVSEGSYRDGAAFLLENESNGQISRPDQSLTNEIVETVNKDNVKHIRAIGFTMPIYYFQPASILRGLLGMSGPDAPRFVEMEEASFFALAHLMGFRAASIVVASDRLESHDGKLSQGFWDGDLDQLELLAFQEAIHAIAGPIPHCHQSESSFQRRSDGADKRERIPGSKSDDGGARGRADRDRPAELYQSLAPRPDRPFAACAAGEAQRPR